MNFKEHLKKYLNDEQINDLIESFKEEDKHALLLNTKKITKEKFKKQFPNIIEHPFVENGFYYDKKEYEFGKHIYHEMGVYYLQEPSAMIVASLLNAKQNDVVLDMCSAPGGKAIQTALKMENTGVIIANDLSNQRCSILLNNIERMGISNTLISNNDFSKIYKNYQNDFDKIILDAPCSGSGMFRKDDKMIADWSIEKVHRFSLIQKELIDIAFSMLKQGGTLVYSTCSYSYEEDEEVVRFLLEKNEDAKIIQIEKNDKFYVDKSGLGIHLFPHLFEGEGHYICLISKGDKSENLNETTPHTRTIESLQNGNKKQFGNTFFSLPIDVKTKGLNIVRYGLKIGELKGKDLIYSYHLSHSVDYYEHACAIKEGLLGAYVKGESIPNENNFKNGMILITYNGIPLSFGKVVNNIIKNHYPNYLRYKSNILTY